MRHHDHSDVDCCPGNHHLPTPSGGTGHSPQLGEAVQGLPQSQHLSTGHQGFLWAFQDLLQLHLGEHQAVGGRTAVRTPEGPPSPGFPPGVEPQGILPHQSSPHQPTSPALRRQSAHKHGGCIRIPGSRALSLPRFPILSAEAQSAPLHSSASLWLLLIPIVYHPAHLSSTVCLVAVSPHTLSSAASSSLNTWLSFYLHALQALYQRQTQKETDSRKEAKKGMGEKVTKGQGSAFPLHQHATGA